MRESRDLTIEEWRQESDLILELRIREGIEVDGANLVKCDSLRVDQGNGDLEVDVRFWSSPTLRYRCLAAVD